VTIRSQSASLGGGETESWEFPDAASNTSQRDVEVGLGASIWTGGYQPAMRLSLALGCRTVWFNCWASTAGEMSKVSSTRAAGATLFSLGKDTQVSRARDVRSVRR